MCEKFIIIILCYYCILIFFSCEDTQKAHNLLALLENVDWKDLKVKYVPNDVVRVIICFKINSFYGVCVATQS